MLLYFTNYYIIFEPVLVSPYYYPLLLTLTNTHGSTTVTNFTPTHPFKARSLSRNQFLSCLKTYLFGHVVRGSPRG